MLLCDKGFIYLFVLDFLLNGITNVMISKYYNLFFFSVEKIFYFFSFHNLI